MDKIISKIKDSIRVIISDRRILMRIISVMLILVAAALLKIHDSSSADIKIESSGTSAEPAVEETEETVSADILFVDIGGAVVSPGVYQVAEDTRLYQVIEMAGGLTEDADTDSVNRASFVEDGQKIIIPVKGAASGSVPEDGSASSSGITPDGLVNINTASLEELKTLSGIGDVTAQKIIDYRSSNAFRNKEDIMSVNGIGNGIFQKIKDRITC